MGQQVARAVGHAPRDRERQAALGGDRARDMALHIDRERIVAFTKRELLRDGIDHPPVGEIAAHPRTGQLGQQRRRPIGIALQIDRARQSVADHPVADLQPVGERAAHAIADDPRRPCRR